MGLMVWATLLKIEKVSQIFGLLFPVVKVVYWFRQKMVLAVFSQTHLVTLTASWKILKSRDCFFVKWKSFLRLAKRDLNLRMRNFDLQNTKPGVDVTRINLDHRKFWPYRWKAMLWLFFCVCVNIKIALCSQNWKYYFKFCGNNT
jgi:hypothetical protein